MLDEYLFYLFATHVTCGLWEPGLADGFGLPTSHKFVMLCSLPLVFRPP
jgi:hypothetical protein